MALFALVVELDLPEDGSAADALAETARHLHDVLPVEPLRAWVCVGDLAEAVAALHGGG